MTRSVDHYTAAEAARILRLSSQRVRQLLSSGELRGVRDEVGHWEVDARSVQALLEERREVLFGSLEDPQRLSELEAEVRELRYFLGRAEARSDMSAQAESALQEALEREQARADRLEAELREARRPSPAPRDAPETASEATEGTTDTPPDRGQAEMAVQQASPRSRSWWRRFFGFEDRGSG